MKLRCTRCGDVFTADKETEELVGEGYISTADAQEGAQCPECGQYSSYETPDDLHSDADPGL